MCHPVGWTWTEQSIAAKLMAILLEVVGATVSETEPLMEVTASSPSHIHHTETYRRLPSQVPMQAKHHCFLATPYHWVLFGAVQAGLDSLGAVELRNAISAVFSVDVPATVAFDYPTVAALASHISSKVRTNMPFTTLSRDAHSVISASHHFKDINLSYLHAAAMACVTKVELIVRCDSR